MKISELLEKLITKKFYANKEDIENKLNVFYAMNKISDEDYSNLVLKLEEVYAPENNEITEITEEQSEVEITSTPEVTETEVENENPKS